MSKAKVSEEDQRQFWNMAIDTWQSSGLSIRRFCKNEGLSEPQFYQWRKRFIGSSPKPSDQDKAGQPAFIEVAIPKNNDSAIELLLTSGNMLRIHPGTDSVTLKDMLSALRQAGLC